MSKMFTLFAILLMLPLAAMAQTPNTDWYTDPSVGVDGSEAEPYEIADANDLAGLARLVNGTGVTAVNFSGKYIKLMADIDLAPYGKGEESWNSGKGWVPIGNISSAVFRGIFEGNNKKISNLFINGTVNNTTSIGLFGYIGEGGSVQNLGIDEAEITGTGSVSGINGSSFGIGSVAGNVVGGSITDCYSTGTVNGRLTFSSNMSGGGDPSHWSSTFGVGGIVGNIIDGAITNCYSAGVVDGNVNYYSATFSNNIRDVQSYTLNYGVGGVAGMSRTGSITNCYSTKTVSGNATRSIASTGIYKSVSFDAGVGGVVGVNSSAVANCYSTGAINGSGMISGGGIIGYHYGDGTISNCAALNPSVSRELDTDTYFNRYFNRIIGRRGVAINANNIAFSEMDSEGTSFELDERYGTSITIAEIKQNAAMGERFTAENGWTIVNGKLPGLFGKAVDMPEHLLIWEDITRYAVSFDLNGGTSLNDEDRLLGSFRVIEGDTVSKVRMPSTLPFYLSSILANDGKWYIRTGATEAEYEYTEFIFGYGGTPVTKNTILYLKWLPAYTVSFDLNGGTGTAPAEIEVVQNSTLSVERKPLAALFTKTNFANDGKWYIRTGTTEADYVYTEFIFGDGGTLVTENTTLYLKWGPFYSVSFNINGGTGTAPSSFRVAQNGTVDDVLKPSTAPFTKKGYINDGDWYIRTGSTEADYVYTKFVFGSGGSVVNGNITLYLHWVIDPNWYDPQIAGAGTAADPYLIVNPKQLAYIALMIDLGDTAYNNNRYYRLENNIDLSSYRDEAFNRGKGWVPIGVDKNRPFRGSFDGGGNVISGLYINDNALEYAGLFGYAGATDYYKNGVATIRKIGLKDVDISAKSYVGGIVGSIQGYTNFGSDLANCYVTGTITATNTGSTAIAVTVGGIAGVVNPLSEVRSCYTTANITGVSPRDSRISGIAGYADNSKIADCVALNPSLTGDTPSRIVANFNKSELDNNAALYEMLNNNGTNVWNNKGPASRDGADISAADIEAGDGTLGGRFNAGNGWIIAAGKLPSFNSSPSVGFPSSSSNGTSSSSSSSSDGTSSGSSSSSSSDERLSGSSSSSSNGTSSSSSGSSSSEGTSSSSSSSSSDSGTPEPSSSSDTTITIQSSSSSDGASPVIISRIASGQTIIQATSNAILLENLPSNAKVQIYNLKGRRIYSNNNHENPKILKIMVQTKGLYLVKAGNQTFRIAVID